MLYTAPVCTTIVTLYTSGHTTTVIKEQNNTSKESSRLLYMKVTPQNVMYESQARKTARILLITTIPW
jgi:hypothetical protein